MEDFSNLITNHALLRAIDELGFTNPSPIQQKAIPFALAKKDLIAQAQTGTGKTAAFALPSLELIDTKKPKVQLLVITPTRELATQVSDEIYSLGKYKGVHTISVYGGRSYKRQIDLINNKVQVVVATPGRLLDLLKNGLLEDFTPQIVVLDEADEMLDMGFLDDIKAIFKFLPEERQTLLFSATMPNEIKKLAKSILSQDAKLVSVSPQSDSANDDIEQYYYLVHEHERELAILRLLDFIEPNKAVIFCRTKKEVDELATKLISSGFSSKALHGDLDQAQREEVIRAFKDSHIDILVATDVAARGIHVNGISHVFNFHMPFDKDSYVHRIGRTGRAGSKGVAITLSTPLEYHSLQKLSKKLGKQIMYKTLPSLSDLHASQQNKTIQAIKSSALINEASEVLNALESELSISDIALKAISVLLSQSKSQGPENIGLSTKAFERLISSKIENKTNKNRRPRRHHANQRRRSK